MANEPCEPGPDQDPSATTSPGQRRVTGGSEIDRPSETHDTLEAYQQYITELEAALAAMTARATGAEARVTELEVELNRLRPKPDPWHQRISIWLDQQGLDRHASTVILLEALGIDKRQQEAESFRRLARTIRIIGGWRSTTNISHGGDRVRGWIKFRPDEPA